jgi:plasmid stabilization system protein ParE
VTEYRLSAQALEDVAEILEYLRIEAGQNVASRMAARLDERFRKIATGIALGHKRGDVPSRRPLRFSVERPYVVAFDPETRLIVRVVHGARNFRRLFPEEDDG